MRGQKPRADLAQKREGLRAAASVLDVYRESAREHARPDPDLSVSQWADRYRYLTQRSSAEPGPWKTDRVPYLRTIMDDLSPMSPVERVIFQKAAQTGGPLALDTPIPTMDGWTDMGNIQVGDQVFDENGQPCRVIYVSAVYTGRPCFRLSLSDGSEFVCDAEHPWVVWDDPGKDRKLRKLRTAEMVPRFKIRGHRNRYAIDVAGPLATPAADLALDPYLLGVWLGNGSSYMNHITVHEDDVEFMKLLEGCGFRADFRLPAWRKGKAANVLIDGGRP